VRDGSDPAYLSALVAPLSADAFLSTCWRQQPLFCDGSPSRFAALLSWPTLNRILEQHWRETFRFRVAKRGRDLDPSEYADVELEIPRIRPRDVTDHLRGGATLSFDGIDEVHEPLTRLAQSFEQLFHASTNINAYASWRTVHGLDLHFDDEEVFVLQVDGGKRWLLYGPNVDHLDRAPLEHGSTPPDGALFDQVLKPGDLLYVPKGCYHLVMPLDRPTLHLTVGVKDTEVKDRPSFSLPWSATADRLPPGTDFCVQLSGPPPSIVDGQPDAMSIEVVSLGRRYRLPRGVRTILSSLADGGPVPMRQVIDSLARTLDESTVRLLLALLVKQNLVAIVSSERLSAVESRLL